jgi:hypothetical protein
MPQISLYIDEATLKKVEISAKKEHLSLSKWVAQLIRSRVTSEYPADFGDLFGSITDDTYTIPDDVSFAADIERESY